MAAKRFKARIEPREGSASWLYVILPFDAVALWGSKGALKVKGTMNAAPFRSSIFPNGDGTHHIMMNKALLETAKAGLGDTVAFAMEPDTDERDYPMPADMAKAVGANKKAAATWEGFPPSARKLYVEWVEGAKRSETRTGRIAKAKELLAEGKRLK
ncbi:MAG: YdeI/OmpD-associated family protein [Candidatus Thermoplasmatota archaeon]